MTEARCQRPKVLECGDMSPLLKRGHVRAVQIQISVVRHAIICVYGILSPRRPAFRFPDGPPPTPSFCAFAPWWLNSETFSQSCPRLAKPAKATQAPPPPGGGEGSRRVYSVILSKTPDLGIFVSSLLSIWPQSTQINPSMPKYRPHTGSYWPKNLVFPFCHLP
jgi:hypothetical protein